MSNDLDTLVDRRRLKRRLGFWRLAAVIALAILVFVAFTRSGIDTGTYIARITVDGVIMEDPELEQLLDDVAADSSAAALLVRINSPGGTTTGSEGLYHALRRVADRKPVVAVMGTMAASGGFVTAIAADHIFARETTLTGSIGVIAQFAQFGELFRKVGITMETVKSAPLKGEPSLTEPLSDEGRAAMQALIDDGYNWFVDLVADRRGLTREDTITLADGRVFSGRQAVDNGLVDAIGGENEARAWLESTHGINADLPVVDVDLNPRQRLLREVVGGTIQKVLTSEQLTLDGLVSVWQPLN